MDAYVVQRKIISDNQLRDLELATAFMSFIREREEADKNWSCHEVCRAFLRQRTSAAWEVSDGYFGRVGYQHAWLWGFSDDDPVRPSVTILDIYPVAGTRPQLVAASNSPWNDLYIDRARAYSPDQMVRFSVGADKICTQTRDDFLWLKIQEQCRTMRFAP